jgi:hypothetical protein
MALAHGCLGFLKKETMKSSPSPNNSLSTGSHSQWFPVFGYPSIAGRAPYALKLLAIYTKHVQLNTLDLV